MDIVVMATIYIVYNYYIEQQRGADGALAHTAAVDWEGIPGVRGHN